MRVCKSKTQHHALPEPNRRRQPHRDTRWFAYTRRVTEAQMSGMEPEACVTLPLHTCAGTLAKTPASVGHRDQQPPHHAGATRGRRAACSSRYSGDEERTGTLIPDVVEHGPHTELIAGVPGLSSSNAGNSPWGMVGLTTPRIHARCSAC